MARPCSVADMFFPASPSCCTRSRSREPSPMGTQPACPFLGESDGCRCRVFLVTVHDPVCTESGNLEAALYGSFLPIPDQRLFPITDESEYAAEKMPGAIISTKEDIVINEGRERIQLRVTNLGDRPIQVRGHFACHSSTFTNIHARSDPITISSRRTRRSRSTAERHMESDWT